MTQLPQGTLDGFARADEGAKRAMDHADRVNPEDGWADQARGFLAGYIKQHASFTSEEAWLAAEAAGIPKPPDRRAWGGIFRGFRGSKKKPAKIRQVGIVYSKLPELHGNEIKLYERI